LDVTVILKILTRGFRHQKQGLQSQAMTLVNIWYCCWFWNQKLHVP